MQITHQENWKNSYLISIVKSFLLWSFTLTVCFLVVGFPLVVVIMTVGALSALILQSIFPASAVLLVAGIILGGTVLAIVLSSIALTVKGIHPQDVRWLSWLHGNEKQEHNPVYAACPLTCNLTNL
jgi:hypothetical protein